MKDAVAGHNAKLKGRLYVPKATKSIPDIKLTIYNNPVAEKAQGSKVSPFLCTTAVNLHFLCQGKGKDEAKPESLTTRITQARDVIQRKICNECNAVCVLVPQANGQPLHKTLKPEHIDLWAELVVCDSQINLQSADCCCKARSKCTISQPPMSMVLSLANAPPHTRNKKNNLPASHNVPEQTPSVSSPFHPEPRYPGYQPPPPFASPLGYPSPYSFLPNPYQMFPSFG